MVGLFGFIVFLYFCRNETIGVCYVCNGGPADGMPYI